MPARAPSGVRRGQAVSTRSIESTLLKNAHSRAISLPSFFNFSDSTHFFSYYWMMRKLTHETAMVADYISSTEEDSRVRRKLGKAIKRFRQVKNQDFAHAENDFKHAKDDLAAATSSFEHLVHDFSHAIDDFSEGGGDPAHALEDHDHAEADFDAAEEKLQHAIKDFRHAVKDFSQALKDLEQSEETKLPWRLQTIPFERSLCSV
jgi:Sec-independent protein translocase protein TatA